MNEEENAELVVWECVKVMGRIFVLERNTSNGFQTCTLQCNGTCLEMHSGSTLFKYQSVLIEGDCSLHRLLSWHRVILVLFSSLLKRGGFQFSSVHFMTEGDCSFLRLLSWARVVSVYWSYFPKRGWLWFSLALFLTEGDCNFFCSFLDWEWLQFPLAPFLTEGDGSFL
jgi:hypothetical protein